MKSTLTGGAVLFVAGLSLFTQSRPQQPPQRTMPRESEARPIRVLFLGQDQAPHSSPAVFSLLASPLAQKRSRERRTYQLLSDSVSAMSVCADS